MAPEWETGYRLCELSYAEMGREDEVASLPQDG